MNVYCRVVNKSGEGEPEQLVFQRQDTLEILEPDTITKVIDKDGLRYPSIERDIEYVLLHMEHFCYIDYQDNGQFKHTLILE